MRLMLRLIVLESFEVIKNVRTITRCYIIDHYLQKALDENPNTSIIPIGTGLDSLAYRFFLWSIVRG